MVRSLPRTFRPPCSGRSRTGSRSTRRSGGRAALVAAIATALTLAPIAASAQSATTDASADSSHAVRNATGAHIAEGIGALALAAGLDRPMRTALRDRGHDGSVVDDLSRTGNALGTASHLIPAMAGAYVVTLATGGRAASERVIAIAAGYAAADITAGVLKEAVGRERPFVHGDPSRFHPFTSTGDFHSFPSGHVTHIVALATGVAMESRRPWVHDVGLGLSLLVGWQRIHADQHWASDVVGAALLSNVVSGAATRAVEHALLRHH